MAKVRREAHACTGRGFSKTDPAVFGDDTSGGFMSRLMSFAIRPNVHGVVPATPTVLITSSTFATSLFTLVGHGLLTGQSVALTTPDDSAEPTEFEYSTNLTHPLSRSAFTEYFVIKLTDDTFQLAISHYNAMKTVPVPITFSADIVAVSITLLGGGANWYLHDDFSRMETVDFATTAVDITAETITLTGNAFSQGHKVTFSSTGTVPGGLVAGTSYWLIYVSAGVYKVASTEILAFAGTGINLTSQGTGTHTIATAEHFIVVTDTLSPVVNDYNTSPAGCAPKFLKLGYVVSESGLVRMQGCLWWDNTTHTARQYWSGNTLDTYDSAVYTYQFLGGDEFLYEAAQLGSTWYTQYVDTFTGISSKLEAITKVGVLQGAVTAGSSVVLQLAAGQVSGVNGIKKDKFYYIYDFVGHSWVQYVKVTAIDSGLEQVTIDTSAFDFPIGSVLTPYAHRYYQRGLSTASAPANICQIVGNFRAMLSTIPYCSSLVSSTCRHPQNTAVRIQLDGMSIDVLVSIGVPDDEAYYDCVKRVIAEYADSGGATTSMNRIYGTSNNIRRTARGTMGQMTNYRTLLGVDYLYHDPAPTTYVDMIRYSESAS